MNVQRNIMELVEEGITLLPDMYTQEQCQTYIARFESIVERFQEEKRPLDVDCQIIENPFRHDPGLIGLLYHETIDNILKVLLDEDFVLINSNVINRKHNTGVVPGGMNIGTTWHTDSRYLGGQRMERGFGFIAVSLFSDFSEKNGGTQYIPKSHLRRERPERYGNYEFKTVCAPAGTLVIFDTGLWHRGGPPTELDRWSLYSYYGPWFVKPYYRFPEMLGDEFGKKLSRPLRRLLHYTSTPPINEEERRNIIVRE